MASTKLNILFILADDMGPWALRCAGNREIHTPNLDRLAARGLRFENAFCVSPVCSPARASLLTGRIPSQHGVHDWIRRGNSPCESPDRTVIDYLAGQPTYTEILAQDGYVCGLSGKWHLGNAPTPQKGHAFWSPHSRGGGPYYHAPMIRNGEEYKEPRYVTDVITDHALEFLQSEIGTDRPFYLGVHYTAPHSPWTRGQHPPEFFDPYFDGCPFESVPDLPMHPWQINSAPCGVAPDARRELLSGYYASITAMDTDIGRLLDALDREGVADDTLVVFTSDNGMNMGHHGIYGKGNGTYPQNMYDSSVKVPFIVCCPGRIPAGTVSDALFSHYDFLPTLLDFIGFGDQIPSGLPGTVLSDVWQGVSRIGNGHVVVFDEYGPVRMIRDNRWKYIYRHPDGPHELYDLKSDLEEECNLINDARYRAVSVAMHARLDDWFARHVEPLRDGVQLPVTGKGQLDLCDKRDAFACDWVHLRDCSPENRTAEP